MLYLYVLRNTVSGTKYYGVTNNVKQRLAGHKYAAKHKKHKCPLYDAMRSYGFDKFQMEVLDQGDDEAIVAAEIAAIAGDSECYNLHRGGSLGFDIRDKGPEAVEEWKVKLRAARKGRQPALGMKHSDEVKKLCGEYGKLRWDIHGRYSAEEVLKYGSAEAKERFGISKTHYHRLRKAAAE